MNNVASLAAEQCLISGLPRLFSSATIRDMDEETMKLIASETQETISEREKLEYRGKILKQGLETMKRIPPGAVHTYY